MLKLFNSNHEEVGSLNKNLVLNTQGKVKIRYGKKFIDLLDNNGNINVKIPKVILTKNSIDDINSDGIYLVGDNLYIYCNKELIEISTNKSDNYISYELKLELTKEQTSKVLHNIGLVLDNIENINSDGIVFIKDKIYYIDSSEIKELSLNNALLEINNTNPTENGYGIIWENGKWKYNKIITEEKLEEFRISLLKYLEVFLDKSLF